MKSSGDEPAATDAARRPVEGHEPSLDRGERLSGRQDHCSATGVDGECPAPGILSGIELKEVAEVAEGDHFVAFDTGRVERPPPLLGDQRESGGRFLGSEWKQADREDQTGAGQSERGKVGRRPLPVKHLTVHHSIA